jgi:hypothetical protein
MAVALMAGLAGVARASDYCIDVTDGGPLSAYTLVGKGFRVPGKNRCKPFMGFTSQTFDVTGSACTTADGSHMYVVLTESARGTGATNFYHMTIDLLSPGQSDADRQSGYDAYLYPLTVFAAEPCAAPQPVLW